MSKNIKLAIAKNLELVNEYFNQINATDQIISQIDLDLLKEHVRSMYEQINALQKANEQSAMVQARKKEFIAPANSETAVPKPSVAKVMPVAMPIEAPKMPTMPEPAKVMVATTTEIEMPTATPVVAANDASVVNEVAPATTGKKAKDVASLYDSADVVGAKFDDKPSVANTIAANPSVGDTLHQHKIADLKKVIGINEKFLFINELFEGSMQAYTDTIEKLNTAATLQHAHQLLEPLQIKYNWEPTNSAFTKLLDLVQRKVS